MPHVDEKNFKIVLFDLLLHEYLHSCDDTQRPFVYIVSPYLSNYSIPTRWPAFLSNVVSVSDIDYFQDLLKLLISNDVQVNIMTLSPGFLDARTSFSPFYTRRQTDFVRDLSDLGCVIYFNDKIHAKIVLTSQGVLEGSANITTTGTETNLQYNTGNYFPKMQFGPYTDKYNYVIRLFTKSRRASTLDFNATN